MPNSTQFIGSSNSNCFTAQTIPEFDNKEHQYLVNPDVGGIAVAISNIVINLALPILLRWNGDDVNTAILILLSQVYPILIATAASVRTNNLSLFDAHFAIAVTASPLSVYFAYSAYSDLIVAIKNRRDPLNPKPTNLLFQKLTIGKRAVRILGLLLPILWLSVNLTITFLPNAFRGSDKYCKNMTFQRWLEFQAVSNFVGVLDVMGRRDLFNDLEGRGGLGAVSLATMWIWALYLVRHRWDIYDEFLCRSRRRSRGFFLWVIPKFLYDLVSACWSVVSHSHPWIVFVIVACLHWSWILGIVKGMIFEGYQLSYGQITSLFTTIAPLLSVGRLFVRRFQDFKTFCLELPAGFAMGVKYLATGSPNPWETHSKKQQQTQLDLKPTLSLSETLSSPTFPLPPPTEPTGLWVTIIVIWILATAGDILWIGAYVKGGSRPNPRTLVNKPHEVWKPFSITLYIFGYCVVFLNILIWTAYFGKYGFRTSRRVRLSWVSSSDSKYKSPPSYRHDFTVLKALNILLLPVALMMCTAPLFSPFAALPIAQQIQWDHFCDSFQGYAILDAPPGGPVTASFYYPEAPVKPSFNFILDNGLFRLDPSYPAALGPLPTITSVEYNSRSLALNCSESTNTDQDTPSSSRSCGYGHFNMTKGLQFEISALDPHETIRLGAVDDEWMFNNDAPSLILRKLVNDKPTGDIILQSAVTSRSHCETLKVCLASRTPDAMMLAPLGLILQVQSEYAHFCTQPRIYTI